SFSPEIEIIDGGTLGFKLMRYYQEYKKVIIIDTVSVTDRPGAIYNLPAKALLGLGAYRKTAHEVEVVEMLEICSLLEEMAEVNVIGVVPKDIESVEINLTPQIKKAFPLLYQEVLKELQKEGVSYQKNRKEIPLEKIISAYANPSMEQR
ncbi:MAG: hydrogenase maturation protease, partial [Epsilonproteobacteria bacterium]|nr:hydrogenase maturation protease [Campylobacterota bacterium]